MYSNATPDAPGCGTLKQKAYDNTRIASNVPDDVDKKPIVQVTKPGRSLPAPKWPFDQGEMSQQLRRHEQLKSRLGLCLMGDQHTGLDTWKDCVPGLTIIVTPSLVHTTKKGFVDRECGDRYMRTQHRDLGDGHQCASSVQ